MRIYEFMFTMKKNFIFRNNDYSIIVFTIRDKQTKKLAKIYT